MTGRRPRPHPSSEGAWPAQPPAATHASHSSNVTAKRPTANGFAKTTVCCGPSSGPRSGSACGEPMMSVPAGIVTISGQRSHSLKLTPGSSARSCAGVSGEASPARADGANIASTRDADSKAGNSMAASSTLYAATSLAAQHSIVRAILSLPVFGEGSAPARRQQHAGARDQDRAGHAIGDQLHAARQRGAGAGRAQDPDRVADDRDDPERAGEQPELRTPAFPVGQELGQERVLKDQRLRIGERDRKPAGKT